MKKESKKKTNKLNNDIEIIEDNKEENKEESMIDKWEKEEKKGKTIVRVIFLVIAFLCFGTYSVIEIINYDSFLNFLPKLLGIIFIFLFLICFTIISTKNKKGTMSVIVGCFLIIIYSIFNILLTLNIISLPNDEFVPNFYNKSLNEVNNWKELNNIKINENYEYSDKISKYHIISQDITYPSLTKDIKELSVTISLGPDLEKEIIVPNFVGKKIDDVLKYIEDNYLSNVKINYETSQNTIDTVISQDSSGTLRRNSPITLTVAKSEEMGDVEIIDFTNKTKLYATSWLNKYGIKVKLEYDFSDDIEIDHVIKQSVVNETLNLETDEVTLTISKGKMMVAPDIASMKVDDINDWIMDNNLKVVYKEEYSDNIKLGDVIDSSIKKDDVVSNGDTVEITISKGNLAMINIANINDFVNWATTNEVPYEINYEFSNSIKKDEIIKSSHKTGEVIKKDDTVIITLSKGKSINIPNFIGMSKSNIQNKCQDLNLNCSFKTGSLTEKTAKDIAVGQSKNANTTVAEGTSLVITLSAGIQEKVNVPSFVGKSKSSIASECKNIGITCSFNYQSGYSNTEKDICVSQNKTGKVNKGSSVTITLSNGPAKTFTVIIDANQLSSGNPTATKATLESKLKNACPGVKFTFKFEKANSGIGYLSPNSQIKVGSNKLVQGKTYTVIINSN